MQFVQYRAELYILSDKLELNPRSKTSSSLWADVNETRKEVRASKKQNTCERRWAEALIRSFTAISGHGALETFNRQKYKGRENWQLSAGGVQLQRWHRWSENDDTRIR